MNLSLSIRCICIANVLSSSFYSPSCFHRRIKRNIIYWSNCLHPGIPHHSQVLQENIQHVEDELADSDWCTDYPSATYTVTRPISTTHCAEWLTSKSRSVVGHCFCISISMKFDLPAFFKLVQICSRVNNR